MPDKKYTHIEFQNIGYKPVTFSSIKVFREIYESIQKDMDILIEKGYAGSPTRYILYINHDLYDKMKTLMLDHNSSVMDNLNHYFNQISWITAEIKSIGTEVLGILIIRILPYFAFVGKCFDGDKIFNTKIDEPKFVIPGGKKDCSHLTLNDGDYLCDNPEELNSSNCKDDKCLAKTQEPISNEKRLTEKDFAHLKFYTTIELVYERLGNEIRLLKERLEKMTEHKDMYYQKWKKLYGEYEDLKKKFKSEDLEIIYSKESFLDLQKMLEQQKIIIGDLKLENKSHQITVNSQDKEIEQLHIDISGFEAKYKRQMEEIKQLKKYRDCDHIWDKDHNIYCKHCGMEKPKDRKIIEKVLEYVKSNSFPYLHSEYIKEILEKKS